MLEPIDHEWRTIQQARWHSGRAVELRPIRIAGRNVRFFSLTARCRFAWAQEISTSARTSSSA